MLIYEHEEPSIFPSFCGIRYDYTIPELPNGNMPITVDPMPEDNSDPTRKFYIRYTDDLTPLDVSPMTVTITAYSYSRFSDNAEPYTSDTSFDVYFLNPCIDKEFVRINDAADLPN